MHGRVGIEGRERENGPGQGLHGAQGGDTDKGRERKPLLYVNGTSPQSEETKGNHGRVQLYHTVYLATLVRCSLLAVGTLHTKVLEFIIESFDFLSLRVVTRGTVCRQNPTTFVLSCLAYFTQHNVLNIDPLVACVGISTQVL